MKKLLITGASGFLGYHLLRLAHQQGYEVYGWCHSGHIDLKDCKAQEIDITDYIAMGDAMEQLQPDIVIHTAALADANKCQQHPALSKAVNVEATKNLAGICSDYQIPFVFTSTDLVFDGRRGMYHEADAPNPLMLYGEHKALAEQQTLVVYPNALVIRCPLMYGAPAASDRNYFYNLIKTLKSGSETKAFTDEYRSAGGAKSIGVGILQMMETQSGILHLAGAYRLSRYEFAVAVAQAYGYDTSLVLPTSSQSIAMAAPRPADVSLFIARAQSLGYKTMSYNEELKRIARNSYFASYE